MEEIKQPKIETETQEKRPGFTKTTSVSVTQEMRDLINNFDISPTEAFRKGVAVSLAELDHPQYTNKLNKKRVESIKNLDALLKFKQLADVSQEIIDKMREITKPLENSTKLNKEVK